MTDSSHNEEHQKNKYVHVSLLFGMFGASGVCIVWDVCHILFNQGSGNELDCAIPLVMGGYL